MIEGAELLAFLYYVEWDCSPPTSCLPWKKKTSNLVLSGSRCICNTYYSECDFISQCETGSVSEKLFESGVCLPSDTKMTEGDLERIIKIIKKLWR